MTSPTCTPIRKLIRRSGERVAVSFGQSSLRLNRALNRIHSASKLGKDTVARRVGYTTPMFPNELIEDRPAVGEPLERTDLIGTHETAVALHICCEDCN